MTIDLAALAEVIDQLHDEYLPVYDAAGKCVGSNTAEAVIAHLSAVPVEGEVERAKEWAATLESVLADVYTILQPIATEGTHAANSPIQRAYDILNSQDFDKWQASRPFTEEDVALLAKFIADAVAHSDQRGFDAFHVARAALDAVTARHREGSTP